MPIIGSFKFQVKNSCGIFICDCPPPPPKSPKTQCAACYTVIGLKWETCWSDWLHFHSDKTWYKSTRASNKRIPLILKLNMTFVQYEQKIQKGEFYLLQMKNPSHIYFIINSLLLRKPTTVWILNSEDPVCVRPRARAALRFRIYQLKQLNIPVLEQEIAFCRHHCVIVCDRIQSHHIHQIPHFASILKPTRREPGE